MNTISGSRIVPGTARPAWLASRPTHFRAVALALAGLFLPLAAAGGDSYASVDYPASSNADGLQVAVTYTIWIPDHVTRLRGLIVHQHGAGTTASIEGSTAAHDLHWQALARKWDCALLGPSYHVQNEKIDLSPGGSELWFDPRHGSATTFLQALTDLAAKTAHPELEKVPWILWGHSGGGIWADVMSTLYPDRVLAIWMRSGSAAMFRTHPEFLQPEIPATVYTIPIMANPGVKEKPEKPSEKGKEKGPWYGNLATFQEYRPHGAPIGFAPDPRTGHECGDSRYLAIPFLDACLAMRLPAKDAASQALRPVDMTQAWFASWPDGEIQSAADFKGDPATAVWLPNAGVAHAWAEYIKTGAVSDSTPPPNPTNVQAVRKDSGVELTWAAEADFESGIASFVILRDGEKIAQVPETPVGKFGRPLFQSMTYHDTPAQPLPALRYVDTAAGAGTPHTYAVVTVNSVGLKSAPSSSSPTSGTSPASTYTPFAGEKTSWHDGFDRFDFVMDEATSAITPFRRDADERFGVKAPAPGQHRCIVVVPKRPAPGNPWSWQGCYWDHQPQAEVELLRRGFHIAFITPDPGPSWDAWYTYLTAEHGLSPKPAFVGMSKGAYNAYTWATAHPDKVSGIYSDNPGSSPELLMKLGELARNDVPLLNISGSIDPLMGRYALPIESIYQQLGGRISMMIKEGTGHHPHSLHDPTPIADFIVQSVQAPLPAAPPFAGPKFTRTAFYSNQSAYRDFPREGLEITTRGPAFVPCYSRYQFDLPRVAGSVTVIEPATPADGNPWVFRADFVPRDSTVDLALLARGFRIVTGPVPYNADGPSRESWDAVYDHLVSHGFSRKPVLAGSGAAAGDAYAWALSHPDEVACVYGQNPIMRIVLTNAPTLDDLAPLARAGVPILHVCGSRDSHLEDCTRALEQKYTALGGSFTVLIQEGRDHYPLAPENPAPAVEFIAKAALTAPAHP